MKNFIMNPGYQFCNIADCIHVDNMCFYFFQWNDLLMTSDWKGKGVSWSYDKVCNASCGWFGTIIECLVLDVPVEITLHLAILRRILQKERIKVSDIVVIFFLRLLPRGQGHPAPCLLIRQPTRKIIPANFIAVLLQWGLQVFHSLLFLFVSHD